MTNRSKPYFLLILGYLLLWLGFRIEALPLAVIPFGLRLSVLLVAPLRYWPWLIGGEWVLDLGYASWPGRPWPEREATLSSWLQPLLSAAGVYLGRRTGIEASLTRLDGTARLLWLAMGTITAIALSQLLDFRLGHPRWPLPDELAAIASIALNHYLGVLLLAPLLIMGFSQQTRKANLTALVRDGWRILLPTLWVLLLFTAQPMPMPQFARLLSLAPVLYFAFNHGWRGACLSLLLFNLSFIFSQYVAGQPNQSALEQLFVAVAGTGALMLGTASDALRQGSLHAAQQNRRLASANRQLDRLAQQLRAAARGNLYSEAAQRRHLATELHDELGQNLTAIQTHLQLARFRLQQAGLSDISASMCRILTQMRSSLHHVLEDLHPAVLDEFGLFRALDEGPIRDLLEAAHLDYQAHLQGDQALLDETASTALYRIAQEGATNAVKHAAAQHFQLRLRIHSRRGGWLALLDIRDDGSGLSSLAPGNGGRGLKGMHDRITALGGQFRLDTDADGTRIRVLLRNTPQTPMRPFKARWPS